MWSLYVARTKVAFKCSGKFLLPRFSRIPSFSFFFSQKGNKVLSPVRSYLKPRRFYWQWKWFRVGFKTSFTDTRTGACVWRHLQNISRRFPLFWKIFILVAISWIYSALNVAIAFSEHRAIIVSPWQFVNSSWHLARLIEIVSSHNSLRVIHIHQRTVDLRITRQHLPLLQKKREEKPEKIRIFCETVTAQVWFGWIFQLSWSYSQI